MDIRSEKDFELGFQIKKIFFVYETGQGTGDSISFKGHKKCIDGQKIPLS